MTFGTNLNGSGFSALQTNNIRGITATGLVATGSSQATALALGKVDINVFSTVASGTACQLPACDIGDDLQVANYGANTLSVYGQTGDMIQNGTVNAAFSVAANKVAYFTRIGATSWSAVLST